MKARMPLPAKTSSKLDTPRECRKDGMVGTCTRPEADGVPDPLDRATGVGGKRAVKDGERVRDPIVVSRCN